jgi:hypothetical protein
MAEMRELVTVEQAERAIRMVAVALPAAGAAVGAIAGAVRGRTARGLAIGLLCGLAGPAVWLLWRMYNGVVGSYGLDSVKGLLVNLALFCCIGLAVGAVIGFLWRRQDGGAPERRDSTREAQGGSSGRST